MLHMDRDNSWREFHSDNAKNIGFVMQNLPMQANIIYTSLNKTTDHFRKRSEELCCLCISSNIWFNQYSTVC